MQVVQSRTCKLEDGFETRSELSQSPALGCLEYSLSDCGNAERMVDQHAESLRFCRDTSNWLAWNGCRWATDGGAIVQLAKRTIRTMQVEHANILRGAARQPERWSDVRQRADAMWRWSQRSEGAARIIAMLRLAESDPRITICAPMLDRDQWLLNLPNGTLDLRSGTFREHRPEDLLTKCAGTDYDPNAKCTRWLQFLEEVFRPNPDVIPFLQRAIGYSLTGDTREHCVFVLLGAGRNGKSTLLDILIELLGDYGGIAEFETFLQTRHSILREDIADMRGRRLISAQEPSMTGHLAENTLKWISGGDRLRARRLYEHAQEFSPSHKLWLAANRLPAIHPEDPALWRRLRVIPFDVSFVNDADRELKDRLRRESSGILNWALEGCRSWQKSGLGSSPSIQGALATLTRSAEKNV